MLHIDERAGGKAQKRFLRGSTNKVLPDDIQYRFLECPVLSLKDLALISTTCKVFQAGFKAKCAAEEVWAGGAATSTFGPLTDLIVSFMLGPCFAYDENMEQVELPNALPYPDGASLTSQRSSLETTVQGFFEAGDGRVPRNLLQVWHGIAPQSQCPWHKACASRYRTCNSFSQGRSCYQSTRWRGERGAVLWPFSEWPDHGY